MEKPTGREVRVATEAWPTADLEIRAEGDGMTFRGYAAVFDSPSEPMPFTERIAPGAFSKTLRDRKANMRMFLNHNTDRLLATTKAGTLRLSEDDKGLLADASLPDTQDGRDLATLIKRGDVTSMSFGFQAVRDKWSDAGDQRLLTEVRLFEVSAITGWPAYPATSASVRSLDEVAAYLLADTAALAGAIAKLGNGERLTGPEAELLEAAIEYLEPPDADEDDMQQDAATPLLETWRKSFETKGFLVS